MTTASMTPLGKQMLAAIRAGKRLSVADFMAAALGDPTHGYYMTRDPFGERGDFTTAPEISQMFGEILGLWAASEWQAMGAPEAVTLIEPGPGRGSLMADALRAARLLPAFRAALTVRLVDISPVLVARQQVTLADEPDVHWHETIEDALAACGGQPVILLANEFLDALPVHQLVMTETGWRERLLGADSGNRFCWTLAPDPTPLEALIPPSLQKAHAGALIELCPAARELAERLARHIKAHGGSALFIDYGHDRPGFGDSLQALKGHAFADPLLAPGEADLTAHVDFSSLASAARNAGLTVAGPVPQGAFLLGLGLGARAAQLQASAPDKAQNIEAALGRLTGSAEMGVLFKAMALRHPALPPAAGFPSTEDHAPC